MSISIRTMVPADRAAVGELITLSTNVWYQTHGFGKIFPGDPGLPRFHFDVYHTLPGSCGFVAVDDETGFIIGSCFMHVRPTHVGLGIMNVHPSHANRKIASLLLKTIIGEAEALAKPLRLVSSAMNLDSFSLYNRAGLKVHEVYQDMSLAVPADGVLADRGDGSCRDATFDDLDAIVELEREVAGIERPGDYRHFIANHRHNWHISVRPGRDGRLDGVLVSCLHPAARMVGPGIARDGESAYQLLLAELPQHRGGNAVYLVPVRETELVARLYRLGARNCELHFAQILGGKGTFNGVSLPSFMPESN